VPAAQQARNSSGYLKAFRLHRIRSAALPAARGRVNRPASSFTGAKIVCGLYSPGQKSFAAPCFPLCYVRNISATLEKIVMLAAMESILCVAFDPADLLFCHKEK
jgi:hypothetical protein